MKFSYELKVKDGKSSYHQKGTIEAHNEPEARLQLHRSVVVQLSEQARIVELKVWKEGN